MSDTESHFEGTYQSRVREVVESVGGVQRMAARVSALLPHSQKVSYQAFQHLIRTEPSPAQKKKGGWKPARGSQWDAAMAFTAGYSALWLSLGIGPKFVQTTSQSEAGFDDGKTPVGLLLQHNRFTSEEIAEALDVSVEEAEGIIRGERMPDDKSQLRKLSTLLRMPTSHLADPAAAGPLAESSKVTVTRLTPDERDIIHIYRKLKPFGKRALRIRVVELQQEFLPGDKTNPFGDPKRHAN